MVRKVLARPAACCVAAQLALLRDGHTVALKLNRSGRIVVYQVLFWLMHVLFRLMQKLYEQHSPACANAVRFGTVTQSNLILNLLRTGTPGGKELLKKLDALALLQKGYEYEEAPGVCGALEASARLLMFEEGEDPDAEAGPGPAAIGGGGGFIRMG